MKKREVTLHWDEYEVGDLVRSTNKKSGLEPGTTYEVTEFIIPPLPGSICEDGQVVDVHGGVGLEDEEGDSFVAWAGHIRPANWWVEVRLDETRHWHWDILNAILGKEGKVYGVYIFDAMTHTYCCEMTPSYWLRHVYDFTSVFLPESMLDEFDRHSTVDSNDHYFHTTDIEAIDDGDKYDLGIFGNLGDTPEEIEEQVREYVQGNPYWR